MRARKIAQQARICLFLGVAIASLPACSSGGGGGGDERDSANEGLPDPGLANVQAESSAAREAMLDEEGGSLSVTGGNGVVYTLTVPADALPGDTFIGMYPVTGVSTLPDGTVVEAGVYFVPEGLQFLVAATLTMELPPSMDPTTLLGVAHGEDGIDPVLSVSRVDGQTFTLQIQHFSGALAVSGEEALEALGLDAPGAVGFANRIATASQGFGFDDPALTAAVLPIYVEWYEQVVKPALTAGGTQPLTDESFDVARLEYEAWLSVAGMTGIFELLGDQSAESKPLAAAYLTSRYEFFNDKCLADPGGSVTAPDGPVAQAARALDVRALARQWQLPLAANHLDDEYLLNNLCVRLRIDTLLPEGLERPGDRGSLIVGTHYSIADGPARLDLPMRVRLIREGAPLGDPATGRTDSAGFFESAIAWPRGVDPLKIDILARLDRNPFRRISRFDRLTLGCVPPQVTAVTPLSAPRGTSGTFSAEITGTPSTYLWSFGGGATPDTSTEPSPAVTFGELGTYSGSLTLTSDCAASTVFFFEYRVVRRSFVEETFIGTVTDRSDFFHIDCAGPGAASFTPTLDGQGIPIVELLIGFEFDCAGRTGALLFEIEMDDLSETSFSVRTGGVGAVVGDRLSFLQDNGTEMITFEGVAEAGAGSAR